MFDLDDTLVRTEDLKAVREACKNSADSVHLKAVRDGLAGKADRHIYSLALLKQIRADHPKLKLGIFTRSPQSYTHTVLEWAYPGFAWDIVVAYEDVKSTKPDGEGLRLAMDHFEIEHPYYVLMVGDSDVDVRAAYHCGCVVALCKTAWLFKWSTDHWNAIGRLPDAVIGSPKTVLDVLAEPDEFLPDLERRLVDASTSACGPRFDKIHHFIPKTVSQDPRAYPIHICGRSFAHYRSVSERRNWHALTASIENHKEADQFPDEWIASIRRFISSHYALSFFACQDPKVYVTVVPHRPGRKARLESLLAQLDRSLATAPLRNGVVDVVPDLLAYKGGVKSQHLEHLNAQARFINVRDHLFVKQPQRIRAGARVLVLDDVCTTGASLIYAKKYLESAGAHDVTCLALAKNVGDVLK
jgi:beta-phosphoglucomutase-like phosphatase (HAD superfamily)